MGPIWNSGSSRALEKGSPTFNYLVLHLMAVFLFSRKYRYFRKCVCVRLSVFAPSVFARHAVNAKFPPFLSFRAFSHRVTSWVLTSCGIVIRIRKGKTSQREREKSERNVWKCERKRELCWLSCKFDFIAHYRRNTTGREKWESDSLNQAARA